MKLTWLCHCCAYQPQMCKHFRHYLWGTLSYISGQSQWRFYNIKYHYFCWHEKKREECDFMGCEESFIIMKPIWHSYVVLTETGLVIHCMMRFYINCCYSSIGEGNCNIIFASRFKDVMQGQLSCSDPTKNDNVE